MHQLIQLYSIKLLAQTNSTQKLNKLRWWGDVSNSFLFSEILDMDNIESHAPTSSTQNIIDTDTIELHAPIGSTDTIKSRSEQFIFIFTNPA